MTAVNILKRYKTGTFVRVAVWSQRANKPDAKLWRCIDVYATFFKRHVPCTYRMQCSIIFERIRLSYHAVQIICSYTQCGFYLLRERKLFIPLQLQYFPISQNFKSKFGITWWQLICWLRQVIRENHIKFLTSILLSFTSGTHYLNEMSTRWKDTIAARRK